MFKKILIANRSEIALRILRTCREMGIDTVAIYSTEDKEALHVNLATESICIGGPKSTDSYLNMYSILTAAIEMGCDAIHPGFGFLSENSEFVRLCEKCNIKFIGPTADVIDKLGNKSMARKIMMENKIPLVPGSVGSINTIEEAFEVCEKIGYPVLIKASAGGGGRGMRVANSKDQLEAQFNTAKAEAKACFGDDDMYIEKLIKNPKHIEFQILADEYGNVIHLGERDCSIQRKNQKMIEESPAKSVPREIVKKMGIDAVRAAKAANYTNVGTVEFIVDSENNYYFIEMNTRIQVEHPVTELITGIDLVKEQLKVGVGLKLDYIQSDIEFNGHAIECRINAENPWNNFMADCGKIDFLHLPAGNGVRVDSALYQGYKISPYYDSMIAKIIVHSNTRLGAIRKMRRALEETIIDGITTNSKLQHLILYNKDFVKGNYNTGFIERELENFLNIMK